MHTEDLPRHDGGDGEAIEGVDKGLPGLDVAPPFALIVEPIYPRDVGALMIAAKKKEVFRELELVAEQEKDRLQTLLPAVDIVAQKQVVGRRGKSAHLKHADEIGVLSMHVAHDLDGRREFDQGRL